MRTRLLTCLVSLLAGCSTVGHRTDTFCAALPPSPLPEGVVFVANGSGDFRTVSTNLSRVVAETGTPLQIETVAWSHGYGRYLADHIDHDNHLAEGERLAAQVAAYRQTYPGRKVYLVGHSAGCAVVLCAAERLPSGSVDRIILLTRRCVRRMTCGPRCGPPAAASTRLPARRTASSWVWAYGSSAPRTDAAAPRRGSTASPR
jgi:pimeloyl-ACP methyl ester carboxylesterase